MKKKKWIQLALVAACLVVYFGYRGIAQLSTDSAAPEIRAEEQLLLLSVEDPESVLLQGITAYDEKDGDVTDSVVVESVKLTGTDGTAQVTYAAFDEAGNVAKYQRQVRYTDYHSPRFTMSQPLLFLQNSNFNILSVTGAEDVFDGDIQHRIRATALDENSVTTLGTHQVELRVTNSLGDTVKLVVPVEVYAAGTYAATLTLTDYLVYLPVGATFDAETYLDAYKLNSRTTSLAGGLPESYALRTQGSVDTQTPGVYTVSYTVTYTAGSISFDGYSKLIVVVEG